MAGYKSNIKSNLEIVGIGRQGMVIGEKNVSRSWKCTKFKINQPINIYIDIKIKVVGYKL